MTSGGEVNRPRTPPAGGGALGYPRYLVEQGPAGQGEDRLVVALAPQVEQLERNGVAPVPHRARVVENRIDHGRGRLCRLHHAGVGVFLPQGRRHGGQGAVVDEPARVLLTRC